MVGLDLETLGLMMSVGVLLRRDYELSFGYSSICIEISGRRFLADLVVMPMEWFNVILGMDWLSRY